jgi:O-antigen ligase
MCIVKLMGELKSWPFIITKDGTFYLTDPGALIRLQKTPHFGFKNKYDFGTGRGYIWSRTFPLMLHTLFIGNGADTFTMYFPQNDAVGIYYDSGHWSRTSPIFDKPHNFALLTFVDTGGISLLALLAIIGIYLVQGFQLYSRLSDYDLFAKVGAGCYLGIVAFLVAGMVYDTSVNVMPLIYGLLGIGIACNMALASSGDERVVTYGAMGGRSHR